MTFAYSQIFRINFVVPDPSMVQAMECLREEAVGGGWLCSLDQRNTPTARGVGFVSYPRVPDLQTVCEGIPTSQYMVPNT